MHPGGRVTRGRGKPRSTDATRAPISSCVRGGRHGARLAEVEALVRGVEPERAANPRGDRAVVLRMIAPPIRQRALVAIAREPHVVGRHLAKGDFEVRANTRGVVVIIDEVISWVGSCVRAVCRRAQVVAAGTGVPRCARFTRRDRYRRVR